MKYVFFAEFRKLLKSFTHEPLTYFPLLIFLYIFFWIITFSTKYITDLNSQNQIIVYSMLGYIIWFFTISIIGAIPQTISEECIAGTYGSLNIMSVPVRWILIVRSISNTIMNIIVILLFSVLIRLFHHVTIVSYIESILVFILSIPGLIGFAFLITAIVLRFQQLGKLIGVFNFLLVIPIIIDANSIPKLVTDLFSYWPVFQATKILRALNIENISLSIQIKDVSILVVSSIIFFIIGQYAFDAANNYKKKVGAI